MEEIEARNLTKTFKRKVRVNILKRIERRIYAVKKVSFKVNKGEIFGLLGPNGAGKTTTIKMICTLLVPDEGEAIVHGFSILDKPEKVRENIGVVLAPDKGFYERLSGIENLVYYGRLYGMNKKEAYKRAIELTQIVGLDKDAYRYVEEYSLGMKAKLSIAKSLIHDPPIVILDEPTVGLDPISARRIRNLILELAKSGKTILLTSHNMWEVENLCNRVILINKGEIVSQGTPRQLKEKLNLNYIVEVEVLNSEKVENYETFINDKGNAVIKIETSKPNDTLINLLDELKYKKYEIGEIKVIEPTLEEVFAKVIGDEKGI
jgi:ABC-type multidrug transport system, ATPase component